MPARFERIKAWSYSTYTQYLQCPLSVGLAQTAKKLKIYLPEPANPAMERGNQVHKEAEAYVKALSAPKAVPASLKVIQDRMVGFRKLGARAELDLAFNALWERCAWMASDVWLRIKVDVLHHTVTPPAVGIVDYKTGKLKPEHAQQRSLYGLGGLQLVQLGELADGNKKTVVTAEHLYLDTTQHATETFTMTQLPKLKKEWLARTADMLVDTTFQPQPGYHCRWCKFRRSAGGPCPIDDEATAAKLQPLFGKGGGAKGKRA